MDDMAIEREILALVAAARHELAYADDPAWDEIDEKLESIGYAVH